MEIKLNEKSQRISFDDINYGEVFQWEKEIYIKINAFPINAAKLINGSGIAFRPDVKVIPREDLFLSN